MDNAVDGIGDVAVVLGRRLISVAVGLIVMCGAAACGSKSGSGASAGSSGPTRAPITIGNIGSYSGPLASSEGGFKQVMQAWAKSVNASGGINGHEIHLVIKDDAGSPEKALTAAKQLVEQDHAIALVGDGSNVDNAFASYLQDKGIPVIGGIPNAVTVLQHSNYFPTGTNLVAILYGIASEAKKDGPNLAFLYCAESPTCASASALLKSIAQAAGVSLVYTAPVSANATSYTAQCQNLKDHRASSFFVGSGAETAIRVTAACEAMGVKATPVTQGGSVTERWASSSGLDGTVIVSPDFPFVDRSTPQTRAFQTAIAKYAPGLGELNGPNAANAWVSGKLFEKAAQAGSRADVTTASLLKGLYSLKDETLGGIAPPLTYTSGRPAHVNCYFTMRLENNKFTEPNGLHTQCAPSALVDQVAAKLAG